MRSVGLFFAGYMAHAALVAFAMYRREIEMRRAYRQFMRQIISDLKQSGDDLSKVVADAARQKDADN